MLFKRFTFLGACVLLFIIVFIATSDFFRAQNEDRFRQEREKFHVEGVVLTSTDAASSGSVTPPSAPPSGTVTTPSPSSAPDSGGTAPGSGSAPDTNILIGPVPPPSSSTPDSAPSSSAPDSSPNPSTPASTPMPSSSTMLLPGASHLPFWVLAAFTPAGTMVQTPAPPALPVVAPPSPEPVIVPSSTNAITAAAHASNTGTASFPGTTNAAPLAPVSLESGIKRPVANESSVIVLLYHQFKPAGVPIPAKYQWTMNVDVFESEMKYIHDNGYHVVPLSDVLRFIKHEITLPPGSVAITIDDGYKSAIVYAAPILKKYGYPWTYFIYPDFITENEGSGAASWKDLLELQAEGVDIESHSMTHPNLKLHHQKVKGVWHNFTPEEYDAWLTNETAGAKALLEQRMGKTITCFAYPYGEYNKEVEAKVIAAGYEAIFTVADNPVHSTTDLHSIGRYTITQGVERDFAAYLRQSALSLTKADPEPGSTTSNPRPIITAVLAPMSADKIDPNSIETSLRDFGDVRHDFDPQTNTVRLYLPRDLIQPVALVNIRVKDATTGQVMVANWYFNYGPVDAMSTHPPIAPATNSAPMTATPSLFPAKPMASTNAPAMIQAAPATKSSTVGALLTPPPLSPH